MVTLIMAAPNTPLPGSPDWKDVLEFVRTQGEKDRAYFDAIFKRTMWGLGLIITAGIGSLAFFGLRSLSDAKEEMGRQTQAEIAIMRSEIRKRIEAEFQTPEITKIVQDVARQRASQEINRIISEEVSKQVQAAVRTQVSGLASAIRDRHLSKAQKDNLTTAMKRYQGFRMHVLTAQVDLEGRQFGDEIVEAFKLAGWDARNEYGAPAIMVLGVVGSAFEELFSDPV